MYHGRPYKYILGALSAVLLSMPGVAGAAVPSTDAIYNANMAATVSKISNNYFDNVNHEVGAFITGAKSVDANTSVDHGQKEQAIVNSAKLLVQKYPEAVPSLLAETKVALTPYYDAVKAAVTQSDMALITPKHIIDETSALEQGMAKSGEIAAATTGNKASQKKSWLSYTRETKDSAGRKMFVTWSPSEWKGASWWSPATTKASQKAWKIAVFNNKYLTITPLSSNQQVATLWGPWAGSNPAMMQKWTEMGWLTPSGDKIAGSIDKFIKGKPLWLEKFNGGQLANVVPRINTPIINVKVEDAVNNYGTAAHEDLHNSHEKPTPPLED
jgi:hypothetical protein